MTPRPLVLPCASNTDGCGTYRGRATFFRLLFKPSFFRLSATRRFPAATADNPTRLRSRACTSSRAAREPPRPARSVPRTGLERVSRRSSSPPQPRFRGFGTGFRKRGFAALSRKPPCSGRAGILPGTSKDHPSITRPSITLPSTSSASVIQRRFIHPGVRARSERPLGSKAPRKTMRTMASLFRRSTHEA